MWLLKEQKPEGAPMSKAYLIAIVWNEANEAIRADRKRNDLLDKHGGRYLVFGGNPTVVRGDDGPSHVVMLEFPTRDAAKSFYNDPGYEPLFDRHYADELRIRFVLADGTD